jgi:tetratricopeptide (TPR) repeat protein
LADKLRRFLSGLLLIFLVAHCRAEVVPGVLIVQTANKSEIVDFVKKTPNNVKRPGTQAFDVAKFENSLILLSVADIASQEIDEDGRLTPIVWSTTDPIFRSAIEDKLIPTPSDNPLMADFQDAMPKLKVGYLLILGSFASEGEIFTTAHLYKGQKEIWKDEIRKWSSQSTTDFENDNAKHSIARTWVQVMSGGPLKDLPQRRKIATPQPGPGTGPQNEAPVPAAPSETKQVLADAAKLLVEKQFPEAINLLRDAVDAEPGDIERRLALVSALMETGEPELAAREARRAAQMNPERGDLWVMAARAWIAAGKDSEAVMDLNEAVARDPEGRETRLLLGEIQISQRRFDLAVEHLCKVIEKGASAYAYRLRAYANGCQGKTSEMLSDLESASKQKTAEIKSESDRRMKTFVRVSIGLGQDLGGEIRGLIQQVRVAPTNPDNKSSVDTLNQKLKCVSSLLSEEGMPVGYRNSAERLLLALKLLAQSLTDLSGSLEKLDEDALTEATINLGEGLKALDSAKAELSKETA